MALTNKSPKASRFLLALAYLILAAWLALDSFPDYQTTGGVLHYRSGLSQTHLYVVIFFAALVEAPVYAVKLGPFVLANFAFLVLPFLYFNGDVHRPWVNHSLRWMFFCGACGYAYDLYAAGTIRLGAHLWLAAAIAAVWCLVRCLPSTNGHTSQV